MLRPLQNLSKVEKIGHFDEISGLSEPAYAGRPIGGEQKSKDRKMGIFNNLDQFGNGLRLALVTGASSGLGKALCVELAKQQVSLILVARNEEALKQCAKELLTTTSTCAVDLSLPEDRQKLIALIAQAQPDLIFNNAGFGLYGPVLEHGIGQTEQMIAVNIQALVEISIAGAQALIKAGKPGTIVNISSAAAFFSYPTFCTYAATKAFVNRFSEGLDAELKAQGIRVLTVCPGQIETGFRKRASNNYPQKKDRMTMSAQTAAQLILKQVKKGKTLAIIDWRYRVLVGLTRLLPQKLLGNLLAKSLHDRY